MALTGPLCSALLVMVLVVWSIPLFTCSIARRAELSNPLQGDMQEKGAIESQPLVHRGLIVQWGYQDAIEGMTSLHYRNGSVDGSKKWNLR